MTTSAEDQSVARGAGKWSKPGVPHRGWSCTGIDDLGAPDATCEMCESQSIRYVHYVSHPEYPDELGVGCVCAGHMEQDHDAARTRERNLKNAGRRRSRWLTRSWRTSAKGNPYLNVDGFNVVLYKSGRGWSGMLTDRTTGRKSKLRRAYSSLDQAKLAVFDAMVFLKQDRFDMD